MNKKLEYRLKKGARVAVDAGVLGETVVRICEAKGGITPGDLVDEARPDGAPLHPAFDWDDASAGEKYRRHQARNLLRVVRVVSAQEPEKDAPVVIHVPSDIGASHGTYKRPEVIVRSIDEFERAISAALAREAALREAVRELEALAQGSGDSDKLAMLGAAMKALSVAGEALRGIRH